MTGRKKSEKTSNHQEIKQDEIDRLRAMLDHDEEAQIEKDMRELLHQRRQKIHRQVAEMESRNKRLLMWSAIVVLMLIVISFWLFKFNEIVSRPLATANYDLKQLDFDQAKEELTTTMDRVKTGIDELKKEAVKLEKESPTAEEVIQ